MPFVPVIADIRFNETGEIREYRTEEPQEDEQPFPNVFSGKRTTIPATATGKYSVRLRLVSTGEIYYDEICEPVKLVPPAESIPDRFNRDI